MHPGNRPPVLFSRWSPVWRRRAGGRCSGVGLALIHDGRGGLDPAQPGSGSGTADELLREGSRSCHGRRRARPTVTIIGSAAARGRDRAPRRHAVTGVELNPVTISLLTTYSRYTPAASPTMRPSARQRRGPRVFRGDERAPDSSGRGARRLRRHERATREPTLSSYLYTVEMIEAALAHLEPGGSCALSSVKSATARSRTGLPTSRPRAKPSPDRRDRFRAPRAGGDHAGYLFTTSTILLRREPFEPAQAERWPPSGGDRERGAIAGGRSGRTTREAAITLAPDEPTAGTQPIRGTSDRSPTTRLLLALHWLRASARCCSRGSATEEGLGSGCCSSCWRS